MALRHAGRVVSALAVGLVVAAAAGVELTTRLDLPARDLLLRLLRPRKAAVTSVVLVDERSIQKVGRWPWPRERLGLLVEQIAAEKPLAIVIDIVLPDGAPGDARMAESFRGTPVILAAALDDAGGWVLPAKELRLSATAAHAIFEVDHDGVLRRIGSTKQSGDIALPALALAAARERDPRLPIAAGRALVPAFRTRPADIPTRSAADLLNGARGEAEVRQRIVFVGLSAIGLSDRAMIPVSDVPAAGVLIHAAATESILAGNLLSPASPLLVGFAGMLLFLATRAIAGRGGTSRLALSAAVLALPAVTAFGFLSMFRIEFPVVLLSSVSGAGVLATEATTVFALSRRARSAVARLGQGLGGSTREMSAPHDVMTELEALWQALLARRADDEQSKRVLAHELKTPLTSMRGLTQLLAGFDLSAAEQRRVMELLQRETDKLQGLVTTLLDLERLPLRDFEVTAATLDFSSVVRERLGLLAGSGRRIVAEIPPAFLIRGDTALLDRVIDNLVGNALKFSPPDTAIQVRLSSSGDQVVLEVEDEGSGIAEEEREQIFRRFARGRSARGTEGLGLGLALVAEIVSWHGGGASVHPARTGGSIFRLSLPAEPSLARAEGQ